MKVRETTMAMERKQEAKTSEWRRQSVRENNVREG